LRLLRRAFHSSVTPPRGPVFLSLAKSMGVESTLVSSRRVAGDEFLQRGSCERGFG